MPNKILCVRSCFKSLVIIGWFAGFVSHAYALKGWIVIQGEITAPTCVVNISNGQLDSQAYTDSKHTCIGHIESLGLRVKPNTTKVTDQAVVNQVNNERIKTVTYR